MIKHIILLGGAILLLLPCSAKAQVIVAGPPTPTTHALTLWFQRHIPLKFAAREIVEVRPLSDEAMDDYLHLDDHADSADLSGDEVDGVFTNAPPKITLRLSSPTSLDFSTLAHEYGHYVWFDLFSKGDRKRYKSLYEHQKSAHHLVSDYAEESLEEGFAEAFSADIVSPAGLQRADLLSYQFLARWQKT